MDLLVVGINHKTAPVEIREKFSFNGRQIREVNRLLKENVLLGENLILSTCNRVEIYAVSNHNRGYACYLNDIEKFLGQYHNLDISDYKDKFYA
jgi:glutamyl-tRNA reductase